jgi:LuxR family maltose regulon positive regulatory protein
VAWLSCEEADNDPVRFLSYLQAALANLDTRIGSTIRANKFTFASSWEETMTHLINDLTRLIQQDTVLILDDYHLLTSETVHTLMQFLLAHLPAHLHLVIATRVDPPLPLFRLRARNQISELRMEELCFLSSEIEAFVHTMRLTLSNEAISLLEERSEGWITGIQLLTLAVRGKADAAGFLQQAGGTHRFLREYVSEEILGQQSAEMQHFLLSTCLLRRLCGPLCDAVLGEPGSKDRLAQLHTANLFVSALDEAGTWYRHHPFFAEALLAYLQEREPERIPELYRRASLWYEEQHQEEEACTYALLAGDQPRAATLLERLMPQLFEQGEFLHMRTFLSRLPPDLIAASPLLSLTSHWVQGFDQFPHLNAGQSLASPLKEQIRKGNDAAPKAEPPELLPLLQMWAAMAQGDTERSIALAQQTKARSTPAESALSRFITASRQMTLGFLYRTHGDLEAAEQVFLETFPMGRVRADHPQFLSTIPTLSEIYEARGQLRALGQLYDDALRQLTQRENSSSLYLALIQGRQASLFYEWNRLAEAEALAQQARELVQRLKLPVSTILFHCAWVQARVARALGNAEQANQLISQIAFEQAAFPQSTPPELAHAGERSSETFPVRFALLQGQLEQAESWAARHKLRFDDRLPSPLSRYDYLEYMTLARILLARGRLQRKPMALKEASLLLDQLRTISTRRNLTGWFREIQILTALVMLAQGQTRQALLTLGPVLAQAEPEGYIRLFADEGEGMAHLLAQITPFTSASPDYIQLLQAALVPMPPASAGLSPSTERRALPDPLSPREQEVLQLVALGLSNQEIADRLVISLHTVKLHVKHLLAKLAVSNRTQAVAYAHELHLL